MDDEQATRYAKKSATPSGSDPTRPAEAPVPVLTIIAHPNLDHVGRRFKERDWTVLDLCRKTVFKRPKEETLHHGDLLLARDAPLRLRRIEEGAVRVEPTKRAQEIESEHGAWFWLGGSWLDAARTVTAAELEDGVTLQVGPDLLFLLHHEARSRCDFGAKLIRGESPAINEVRRGLEMASPSRSNVLLLGESGTGKELAAAAIHAFSKGNLVASTLATMPLNLVDAAIFGQARNAFNNAPERKGYLEQAGDGTLFLDEIAQLPIETQDKLLRLLDEGRQYRRLGEDRLRTFAGRFVFATNKDLDQYVKADKFKPDLVARFGVLKLVMPPLHERRPDIPLLFWHFLRQAASSSGYDVGRLTSRESPLVPPELLCRLLRYDWPLNVRQLRATAEWLWTFNRQALEENPNAQVEFGGTRAMPAPEAFRESPSAGRDEAVSCGGPRQPSKGLVDLDRAELESLFEEREVERDPGRSLAATVDRLRMKHGIVVSVGQLRRELRRREILREAEDTVGAEALRAAWTECGGDVTAAARKLGLTAQDLGDELRKEGIAKVGRFKRMAKSRVW